MDITPQELITWLFVGAVAGYAAGAVVKRKKKGFGTLTNLGIGLAGAVIGGVIFNVFNINLGLDQIQVSAQDLISALLGSFLFLAIVWTIRKVKQKKKNKNNTAVPDPGAGD